jgi:hypothetical protein
MEASAWLCVRVRVCVSVRVHKEPGMKRRVWLRVRLRICVRV